VTEMTDSGVRVNTWLHESNTFYNQGTDEQQDSSVLYGLTLLHTMHISAFIGKILRDRPPPDLLLSGSPSASALLPLQAVMKGMRVAVFVRLMHEPGCS